MIKSRFRTFFHDIIEKNGPRIEEFKYTLYLIRRSPLTLVGFLIVLIMIILAIVAPYIAPYPEDIIGFAHLEKRLQPPSQQHWFGLDEMGRDIFSRVIFGCRISLEIGILVIIISASIGTIAGALAGYYRGWVDFIIMRITDTFLALPSLILALAIAAAIGTGLFNLMVAIAIAWWPWYARLVRAQALSLSEATFIEAAKAMGVTDFRIVLRHVIPNCIAPIVVQASLDLGYVILTAASLGFLGLGAQPPAAEWGLMVSIGRGFFPNWWWITTFPGLAIFISVLGFNLLGDGIR
ncbi:MAG: ABC transporter permease [Candidatus Heimdallarchaeota archaeon]